MAGLTKTVRESCHRRGRAKQERKNAGCAWETWVQLGGDIVHPHLMETYGQVCLRLDSHIAITRPITLHLLSCKGHKSTVVESISHNMLGYLQSNPHIMINDDEWLQPQLRQLHFDRSLLAYAVCLLTQVITVGSLNKIHHCVLPRVCFQVTVGSDLWLNCTYSIYWCISPLIY